MRYTPKDYIMVKLEKASDNEYHFSSGFKIMLYDGELGFSDSTYNPNDRIRIYGEVATIPLGMSRETEPIDVYYGEYKYLNSIIPEVKIGDKVYFYYLAINEYNLIKYDGELYYKVRYDSIICVVRAQQIIPIGAHILVEPYEGKGVGDFKLENGKVVHGFMQGGFLTPSNGPLENVGILRHIGTPLKDAEAQSQKDDIVMFIDNANFLNTIEEKNYYVMRQSDVLCTLGTEKEALV